jgi:hypothetical protein
VPAAGGFMMVLEDLHCFNMIDKVQSTSILPNSQSNHIVSIDISIRDILATSVKRPIEESNLLVNNEINLG